tara:strand:- start:830 stop:1036 length:207 start_codon:yes stop_codon:yes gene_type:complete
MIAFNEMKQLARKANVHAVLERDNLTPWARKFWGNVFDTIATDEVSYNTRIEADRIMKEMNKDVRYKR